MVLYFFVWMKNIKNYNKRNLHFLENFNKRSLRNSLYLKLWTKISERLGNFFTEFEERHHKTLAIINLSLSEKLFSFSFKAKLARKYESFTCLLFDIVSRRICYGNQGGPSIILISKTPWAALSRRRLIPSQETQTLSNALVASLVRRA